MGSLALSLLTNPKVIAGIVLSVLLGAIGVQSARLHHAKADLATARAAQIDPVTHRTWQSEEQLDLINLGTCAANLDQAQATVNTQGASISALKAASDAASAKASVAVQQAQAATASLSRHEAQIAAIKPTGDACAQADAILSDGSAP